MPKSSSDDILELTDIVEEGCLPEKKTDEGSESSFEDELDALFGDVEDINLESGNAKEPPINPNEELSMPDMSDLDSLLDDLGREGNKTGHNPGDEDSRQIEGVDELLADILPEDPAEVEDAVEKTIPAKPAAPASGEDELDALLDELNSPGEDETASEAGKNTADKKLPLILDPDALEEVKKAEEKESASPAEPAHTAASAAQEEFSPAPESAEEPEKDEEAAPLEPAPPATEPLEGQPADMEALLTKLDAEIKSKPDASAQEAGKDAPEPLKGTADEGADNEHLKDLDALIDDIMTPAGTTGAGQQPEVLTQEEDLPAAEKDGPAPEEHAPAPDPVAAPVLEPLPAATKEPAPHAAENLEELAEKLAQGPLFAAIQNMVGQELDSRFGDLENRLAEKMDKAAAAAAAKVIREEISAMLQDL